MDQQLWMMLAFLLPQAPIVKLISLAVFASGLLVAFLHREPRVLWSLVSIAASYATTELLHVTIHRDNLIATGLAMLSAHAVFAAFVILSCERSRFAGVLVSLGAMHAAFLSVVTWITTTIGGQTLQQFSQLSAHG